MRSLVIRIHPWLPVLFVAANALHAQQLTLEHIVPLPDGGEIVAYDAAHDALLVTGADTIRIFDYDAGPSAPTFALSVAFADAFAPHDTLRDISSVAVDPLGRGFAATTLIPADNGQRRGRVAFFDLRTGKTLAVIEGGYHPDSLVFTPDGRTLIVVNEGEYTNPDSGGGGDNDAPGSLSLIEIAGRADRTTFTYAGDFPLVWHALEPSVTLDALRINDPITTQPYRHAEPEYAAIVGRPGAFHAVVTFQENNAMGVFDLQRKRWATLASLGNWPITIDADERDGPRIDDEVLALPMPDTLVAFEHPQLPHQTLLATADEGDFRVDDGDRRRIGDFANGHDDAFRHLERLRVSIPDSDPDADGQLDQPVAPGTRGVSLWQRPARGNAPAQRIGHTGSLERFLLEQDPARHNLDSKSVSAEDTLDARSDDKGPEPEGLAALPPFDHDADPATPPRTYLLVALERQNGLVLLDVTDPAAPTPTAYRNDLEQLAAPESIVVIPEQHTLDQTLRFLVGYEGNDANQRIGVGLYRLDPSH